MRHARDGMVTVAATATVLLAALGSPGCAGGGTAGAASVKGADDDASAANVGALLDRFHGAASRADFDAYFGCMTDRAVFLGTDATERWQGDEFRDFVRPYFTAGRGWTYRPHHRRVDVAGTSVAWFDELLDSDSYGTCRGSGVALLTDGSWKIAQYNLSIPIPNDLARGVVDQISAFERSRAVPPAPAGR